MNVFLSSMHVIEHSISGNNSEFAMKSVEYIFDNISLFCIGQYTVLMQNVCIRH